MKICTTNFCSETYIPKFLLVMKITALMILICIMQVSAATYAQNITIKKIGCSIKSSDRRNS